MVGKLVRCRALVYRLRALAPVLQCLGAAALTLLTFPSLTGYARGTDARGRVLWKCRR